MGEDGQLLFEVKDESVACWLRMDEVAKAWRCCCFDGSLLPETGEVFVVNVELPCREQYNESANICPTNILPKISGLRGVLEG